MTKSEMGRKNLELLKLFTQKVIDSAEFAKQIPKGATVVFLPENDPELAAANRRIAQRVRKDGKKVVLVKMELVPKTTYVPHFIVLKSAR
jgi:hypothetical protein